MVPPKNIPAAHPSGTGASDSNTVSRRAWLRFGAAVLALTVLWENPLSQAVRLALHSDLHSHILLVPCVAVYLVWSDKQSLPHAGSPAYRFAACAGIAAAALAFAGWRAGANDADIQRAWWILAYVSAVAAMGALLLGGAILRSCAFSFAFLVFLVPLPQQLVDSWEIALQHGSAEVADWIFIGSGIPSMREGQTFRFPGLSIQVAQECSGFRSTLVLFIVSLVAAQMFLKTLWKRALLVAVIIPLGLLRNAFRIFVLATLTVYVDPRVIDSPLHHKGGPLFFVLSLAPLNILLWLLYRSEQRRTDRGQAVPI